MNGGFGFPCVSKRNQHTHTQSFVFAFERRVNLLLFLLLASACKILNKAIQISHRTTNKHTQHTECCYHSLSLRIEWESVVCRPLLEIQGKRERRQQQMCVTVPLFSCIFQWGKSTFSSRKIAGDEIKPKISNSRIIRISFCYARLCPQPKL